MNKIKLLGVRDLLTENKFEANRDYGIMLVASRISKEIPDSFTDDEPNEVIYKLKVSEVQSVIDLKEKTPIEFEHGKTPSQKLRYAIVNELGAEEYEKFMGWLLTKITELTEEYRELGTDSPNK